MSDRDWFAVGAVFGAFILGFLFGGMYEMLNCSDMLLSLQQSLEQK